MWNGEPRRSPRITELEARKTRSLQEKSQSKGKGICDVPEEGVVTGKDDSYPKKRRKKIKMRHLDDLMASTDESQVQKKAGSSSNEEHHTNAAAMPSGTALPERRKLSMLLRKLKRRDSHNLFAKPVDPEEVKGYYDLIKEPMDFGTISAKLEEGKYKTVEEFEHDVLLVSSNAMLFNRSKTIFYRQARAIRELAKKLFGALKNNPENFEREFSMAKLRVGKRTKTEVNILNSSGRSTSGLTSKDRRGERRSEYSEVGQRGTYSPLNTFLTENTAVYCSAKQLVQNQQTSIGYKESLMQFVKDLGPTAQLTAERKLQKCTEEALNPHNATSNSQLRALDQFLNVASSQKGITAAPSSSFLQNSTVSRNSSGNLGIQGNTLHMEKVLTFDSTDLPDGLRKGIVDASNTLENLGNYCNKSVQPIADQDIRRSQLTSALFGGGNSNFSAGNTHSDHRGKPVQTFSDQNIGNPHFNNPLYGISNFINPLFGDGSSSFSTWKTHNGPSNIISSAIDKGKNVEIAKASSLEPMMQASKMYGSSSSSSSSVPWLSLVMPGSSQSPVISSMHGLDSNYLEGGLLQQQTMDDRGSTNHGSTLEQAGQAFNWFWPTGSSQCPVIRPMHELDSNYLRGGLHQHQAMADRGSTDHGSDVEQAGQVFNWFWPTGSSQSPVIHSMHGLDSDYLGGGLHQYQSLAHRGSTNHGSNLQQAGQAFNWFSPTDLGPQPVFNQQSPSFLADLIDKAGPSQWRGWDTSTSKRQQTIQLSDIDAWFSTRCD